MPYFAAVRASAMDNSPIRTLRVHRAFSFGALLVAALILITLVAGRMSLVNAVIFDLNGAEENVTYGIIKVMKGLPLYSSPEAVPFDVIQYTPAYYALAAGIGTIVGVDPLEPQQVYALSRTIGLVLNLGFVIVASLIALRLGAPRWAAALWCVALFALLPRQMYSRPDALYLLFFALAMLSFLRGLSQEETSARSRNLMLASLWCSLAVLAKQTGVLPMGIIGLHFMIARQWKDLGRHVIVCTLVAGSILGWMFLHYGAETVYQNIVVGVRNGFSTKLVRTIYLSGTHWGLILTQAAGVILAVRMLRELNPMRRALGLAIGVTFVFGLVTSLKHGSSHTYYMENVLLASAAIAALAVHWDRPHTTPVHWAVAGLALFCVEPGKVLWGSTVLAGRNEVADQREAYTQASQLAQAFRTDPALQEGLVLITEHDHLENFLVGRSVITQKDVILLYSVRRHFDLSGSQRALNDGSIRFVVSRKPFTELPLVGSAYPKLTPLGERNGYLVFENSAHVH